ncbi:suppressor of rasval19 [Elasticomyces elasticus]|nr:suppressor of rasval19 [Elasticomyces elasticus]
MSRPASIADASVRNSISSPLTVTTADNPLTTLIRRLEAATSRLEDIASSAATFEHTDGAIPVPVGHPATSSGTELPALVEQASHTHAPKPQPLPGSVTAFDELIKTHVAAFVDASAPFHDVLEMPEKPKRRGGKQEESKTAGGALEPVLPKQAQAVAEAFAHQRKFILLSTKAKKPDFSQAETAVLYEKMGETIAQVESLQDRNRGSPVDSHLTMVAAGIDGLRWAVGGKAQHVLDALESADYWKIKLLNKDERTTKFSRSYIDLLNGLAAYVGEHFKDGLTWNNNGIDAFQAHEDLDNDSVSSTPTTNGAPPPPPPPPLPVFDSIPGSAPAPPPPPPGGAPKAAPAGGDMGSVFAELNRGASVTSGLKKVDPSQMTHKNPSLRAAATDPIEHSRSKSPGPDVKPKPPSMRQNSTSSTVIRAPSAATKSVKRPEKMELDGRRWIIENYDSPSKPVTVDVELSQTLLISNCKNTTIELTGKANAISIDNSPRLKIKVSSLVSSIDVIKCSDIIIEVDGKVPTVLLDQVDGGTIKLGVDSSLALEVFTSKCTAINVILPPDEDDINAAKQALRKGEELNIEEIEGKMKPLPEQIRTSFVTATEDKPVVLASEIVQHAG